MFRRFLQLALVITLTACGGSNANPPVLTSDCFELSAGPITLGWERGWQYDVSFSSCANFDQLLLRCSYHQSIFPPEEVVDLTGQTSGVVHRNDYEAETATCVLEGTLGTERVDSNPLTVTTPRNNTGTEITVHSTAIPKLDGVVGFTFTWSSPQLFKKVCAVCQRDAVNYEPPWPANEECVEGVLSGVITVTGMSMWSPYHCYMQGWGDLWYPLGWSKATPEYFTPWSYRL